MKILSFTNDGILIIHSLREPDSLFVWIPWPKTGFNDLGPAEREALVVPRNQYLIDEAVFGLRWGLYPRDVLGQSETFKCVSEEASRGTIRSVLDAAATCNIDVFDLWQEGLTADVVNSTSSLADCLLDAISAHTPNEFERAAETANDFTMLFTTLASDLVTTCQGQTHEGPTDDTDSDTVATIAAEVNQEVDEVLRLARPYTAITRPCVLAELEHSGNAVFLAAFRCEPDGMRRAFTSALTSHPEAAPIAECIEATMADLDADEIEATLIADGDELLAGQILGTLLLAQCLPDLLPIPADAPATTEFIDAIRAATQGVLWTVDGPFVGNHIVTLRSLSGSDGTEVRISSGPQDDRVLSLQLPDMSGPSAAALLETVFTSQFGLPLPPTGLPSGTGQLGDEGSEYLLCYSSIGNVQTVLIIATTLGCS